MVTQEGIGAESTIATIPSGSDLSGVIRLGVNKIGALELPAAWDAASIVVHGSYEVDGNFTPVRDDEGNLYEIVVGAGHLVAIDNDAFAAAPFRCIKLQSVVVGTPGTGVNQTADRDIRIHMK